MPRPRNRVPTKPKTVYLPEDVYAKVEILLTTPSRGRPKQGAWSDLVTALLRTWLQERIVDARTRTADGGRP